LEKNRPSWVRDCVRRCSPRGDFPTHLHTRAKRHKKACFSVARLWKCHHPPPDFTAGTRGDFSTHLHAGEGSGIKDCLFGPPFQSSRPPCRQTATRHGWASLKLQGLDCSRQKVPKL